MAISFMQKLRLAFRGWSRRREDDAKRKEQEFLQRNVTWAKPAAPAPSQSVAKSALAIDLEGLQVAYLDDSGKMSRRARSPATEGQTRYVTAGASLDT
jgi:hypothetical protein